MMSVGERAGRGGKPLQIPGFQKRGSGEWLSGSRWTQK